MKKGFIEDISSSQFKSSLYTFRAKLFRAKSFEIINDYQKVVLKTKPPKFISSDSSIFSTNGNELISCENTSSLKKVFISGVYSYEFKDILANQIIGGLKGCEDTKDTEYVRWQILDSHEKPIGYIKEQTTLPSVRYFGKPVYDVIDGYINDKNVFRLSVDLNSFQFRMYADFSMDNLGILDRKLGLAIAYHFAVMKRTPSND